MRSLVPPLVTQSTSPCSRISQPGRQACPTPRRVRRLRRVFRRPTPPPSSAVQQAPEAPALGDGASICGIPRSEWLQLQAPARYLGTEFGSVHKPWSSASVRFVLAYPEVYEVGASNLGHIVLYTVLNDTQDLLCDRCYLPAPDAQALLQRHGAPLFAVESRRPLLHFTLVGLSLAYELSCTNMLQMLHLSGIPLTSAERADADTALLQRPGQGRPSSDDAGQPAFDVSLGSMPLIFAGGPTATSNPEPYADCCDFFALGDGEDCLPEIGRCIADAQRRGLSRRGTLLHLAKEVRGVYVPQFYDAPPGWGGAVFPTVDGVPPRVLRRVASPNPRQQIGLVPFTETVHDRLTIEIRRGCTRGCRFCQPGMLTRPARDVDPEEVVAAVEEGVRKTGYTDFSLLSLSCSDYLALPAVGIELRNRLAHLNISLSLPSQRVDRFDENIAALLGGVQKTPSITFAPEAGTQRLRDIINKGLSNAELRRGVVTAFDQGWRKVKLYFMIGLPGETDEDVAGILETIIFLQRECRGRAQRARLAVTATISNFTPKPHTPFQWHSVSTQEFTRKQDLLRQALRRAQRKGVALDVKLNFTPVRISAMEDFLGRGDRRLFAVVRAAWERGACNEAWWEGSDTSFAAWDGAIADSGMSWKYRAVEAGEWDVLEAVGDARFRGQGGGGKGRVDRGSLADNRLDAPLPWDHIDTGISRSWLKADLQRALEAVTVSDCSHSGVCSECGVCDDGERFGSNVVATPPPIPEFTAGSHVPDSAKAQRLRLVYSRRGDAVCIGHLDTMRLFERAVRRAALSVSQDESPFHSRPRIVTALALGLGATSDGEVIELLMAHRVEPATALAALQAQMPEGMTLMRAAEYPIFGPTGKALTLGGSLVSADWLIHVGLVAPAHSDAEAAPPSPPTPTAADFAAWCSQLDGQAEFLYDTRSKGGTPKTLDLRPALLSLRLETDPEVLGAPHVTRDGVGVVDGTAVLRFCGRVGVDENGQGVLGPDYLAIMLSRAAGAQVEVLHAHRVGIATHDAPWSREEAVRHAEDNSRGQQRGTTSREPVAP